MMAGGVMVNVLSAQQVFNGTGFDDSHMLRKAERELSRLRLARGFDDPYDYMMNFAISLASVSDWTFHIHLANLPLWRNKNEHDFTNWVKNSSDDAFVFIDISNEYKHAKRRTPSALAEKMMLSYIDLTTHQNMRHLVDQNKGWIQKIGESDWFFFPSIRFNEKTEYFFDPAERAIAWWKAFLPSNAQPMSR